MAIVKASLPISMDVADLNRFVRNFVQETVLNDVNAVIYGNTYQDVYEVVFQEPNGYFSSIFGGYDLAFYGGVAYGTATAYMESYLVSGVWTPVWGIEGVSIPANSIYQAAQTASTVDDTALIAALLAGNDTFYLSAYSDQARGFSGDDYFEGRGGNDLLDGGTGRDVSSYSGLSTAFSIVVGPAAVNVIDRWGADGTDTLVNFEQLRFRDTTLDIAWFSEAATVPSWQFADLTDMYIAYFDRAPDAVGLFYWASRLADGMTLPEIAKSFFVQPETFAAYPVGQSHLEFVTKVYNNMLGRAPDAAGLEYWTNDLATGAVSKDEFMLAVIYGARASTGSPADVQYLANKNAVGRDFAVNEGLNNVGWARAVMDQVDSTPASIQAASALIDSYATAATSLSTPDLIVHLVGLGG